MALYDCVSSFLLVIFTITITAKKNYSKRGVVCCNPSVTVGVSMSHKGSGNVISRTL